MFNKFATTEEEYAKNEDLKKEDVQALLSWANKQPHLPKLTEIQAINFLISRTYHIESTKVAIENYFTCKTHCPEMFQNRTFDAIASQLDVYIYAALPEDTPEGYRIYIIKLIDTDASKYNCPRTYMMVDMITNLVDAQRGTCKGHIFIVDAADHVVGHLLKLNLSIVKKFTVYVQEAAPMKLISLHVLNLSPLAEKCLNLYKQFIDKKLVNQIYAHTTMDTFYKHIPKKLMPKEYGGSSFTLQELNEINKKNLKQNEEFFHQQELFLVDESKRQEKNHFLEEIIGQGVDGSFKKLSID